MIVAECCHRIPVMEDCLRRSRIVRLLLVAILCTSSTFFITANGEAVPIAQCNVTGCTIDNAYGLWIDRFPCKAASVEYPKTEQEIIKVVAYAAKNKLKIKVGSKHSHSTTKLVCPGGEDGIFISTKDYASVVHIDKEGHTVTAQAGIQLRDLVNTLADAGLSLVHVPYWDGLSLAGLLGTGAHGSSLTGKGSAVHEYVTEMRLVVPHEGSAKVVILTEKDDDLKAARLSLGVLGVISTITLTVEPLFKRSVTLDIRNDDTLEDRVVEFARAYEFGDVRWYPSQHKVIYKMDTRVPLSTPGDGYNTRFRASPAANIEAARTQEDEAEARRTEAPKCALANSSLTSLIGSGAGYANNFTTFTSYPVIGFPNDIQTGGGCQNANDSSGTYCNCDRRIKGRSYFETATYIPLRHLRSFILDVKSLQAKVPGSLCNVDVYSGFLMRFVPKSNLTYLGALEDAAEVNFDYYRAYDAESPKLDEDVVQEIEQIGLFKYKAKPHWGKNRNLAFDGVAKTYPDMKKFLKVVRKYDPEGLFSSEWSDAILGINGNINARGASTYKPFCALEGLCVCSEDVHCNPGKKYFCRSGRIFSKARVCRYEP